MKEKLFRKNLKKLKTKLKGGFNMLLIEKLFFYLLIFFLPFQVRKVVYQFGTGFNEWTSIYLYLTDILVFFLFLIWFLRLRKERFLKDINWAWFGVKMRQPGLWLIFFVLISFISLSQARNIGLGFYIWFKLIEFTIFFFYCKFNFNDLSLKRFFQVIVASGLIQSCIAIGQYFSQKSLGLRFLKESLLGIDVDGIAKIGVDGFKLIRAYGGLPHPNLLALFLFLSIFSLYYLWLNKKYSFQEYLILSTILSFLLFGFFLTFSRSIIFTFFFSSLFYFIFSFKKNKKQVLGLFLVVIVFSLFLSFSAWPEISSRFQLSMHEQSVGLRSFYNETAFEIIKESPLLGVGLGNFVWLNQEMFNLLPTWVHQPIHNIYLLIASEVGLIGLIIFLFFLYRLIFLSIKFSQKPILIILFFSFLFIGFFDHFFLTLQQGQLIFWLILGLLSSNYPQFDSKRE